MFLEPGAYYHIFNHANGNEKIFVKAENYYFFLEKYKLYLEPFINTYCYCLMPNHFHLLISVKQEKEVLNYLEGLDSSSPFPKLQTLEKLKTQTLEKLVSKQFSNCFSSYTQAFNKQQSRMGSLFMKNFKRKKVHTEEYFRNLVHYIHFNPVEAKFCKYPNDYSYTSYREILKDDSGFLCKKEILEWFGDIESFICFHQNNSPRLR